MVKDSDIEEGSLFPSLAEIRSISFEIAFAVAEKAYALEIARNERPDNLKQVILDYIYDPKY